MSGCVQRARQSDDFAYTLNGDRSNIEFSIPIALNYGLQRIDLTFSTLDKNGLIFLGMDPPPPIPAGSGNLAFDGTVVNFYALQMEDGYLVSLFDFGVGFVRVVHSSIGRLNDGASHNVTLKAKSKFVRIWVDTTKDGDKVADIVLTGKPKFKVSRAFIGGLPMREFKPHRYLLFILL